MARPKTEVDGRVGTSIRLPPDLHDRLVTAAAERDISINRLVTRALEDYLPRLIPVEEIQWTRPKP